MKELSIEQKAKRYDEAREKIALRFGSNVADEIFSQFEMSEDEKIRKAILELVHDTTGDSLWVDYNVHKENALAWLEKQCEQKPAEIDNKFLRMRETKPKDISEFLDRLTTVEQEFLWEHIAKIRELDKEGQKPQGKSALEAAKEEKVDNQNCVNSADESKIKPIFKTGDRVIGIVSGMPYFITEVCDDHYNTESGCIIMFCSQDNFELYEQKPIEWSEEDEDNFKHLMDEIVCLGNSRNSANRLYYDRLIKFIKELKNRVQPKEKWCNKDERMLDRLIAYFEKQVAFTDDDNPRYANWLKSLRTLGNRMMSR